MPVPTSMSDLSTTAASNYPVGSEAIGNNLDNYLRAHASLIRQPYALASSSIASASTVNVAAANGESVQITGTTTISSLGTGFNGCLRELRFSGALTIVHSASLQLPGATNITTAAGDIYTFRCTGSSVWVFVGGRTQPAAGLPGNLPAWATTTPASKADSSLTMTAGNGLTGGGDLTTNRTFTLGTPDSTTLVSTNAVTSTSHSHAFAPGGSDSQFIRGDGALQAISARMVTTDTSQTGLSGNKTWAGAHTFQGALSSEHTSGTGLVVNRTNAAVNSSIEYRGTGGSIYAGLRSATQWAVNDSASLSDSPWLEVTETAAYVNGNEVYHTGNLPAYPSNYVTTNSTQTGLSGNKTWTGAHTFNSVTTTGSLEVGSGVVARSGGTIYMRPNGAGSASGEMQINSSGNVSASGTVSDVQGNLRRTVHLISNSSISLASSHCNAIVEKTGSGNAAYTIQTSTSSTAGDMITVSNQSSSGNITITRGTSTSLYRNGVDANIIVAPGESVTIFKCNAAGRWAA